MSSQYIWNRSSCKSSIDDEGRIFACKISAQARFAAGAAICIIGYVLPSLGTDVFHKGSGTDGAAK
jgi:hypothetical protein